MKEKIDLGLRFIFLVLFIVVTSIVSVRLWSAKSEKSKAPAELKIEENMTLVQIGGTNNLEKIVLKKAFDLKTKDDLKKTFSETGLSIEEASARINKYKVLQVEDASKNWGKIALKFALWFIFLIFIYILMRKKRITTENRIWLYFIAVLVFGVILGADPSPMGTIKDNFVLIGSFHVIFPPRIVAFVVMLLMVILANKFICSWGCQLGTLQDLIFRINKDKKGKPVIAKVKIPFVITNTIRIIFFLIFAVIALVWAFDIIEPVDLFKIFKPATLGIIGIVFAAIMFSLSLVVYRPWCHFFCPFGLIGWIAEKISITKIKVDYTKCIGCGSCIKSCPSTVMEAIIKKKKTIPDCFSCASCIESCPVDAISFSSGKRGEPTKKILEKLG
ncbi:MAG TPA: 4Fe-4S binding protein [Candidatus Cloacimonetes bacterium]|nr:4Fe-4S binding protein [Candidatus Cloacimonadota bacterium]